MSPTTTTAHPKPLPPSAEQTKVTKRRHGGDGFEIRWRNPERTLVDYIGVVWQRRWTTLWIALACSFLALIYALRKPNTYAARATLMVHGAAVGGSAADAAANLLGTGNILPTQVMTAVEIIRSRVVLRRVAERIGHEEILRPYETFETSDQRSGLFEWMIDAMHAVQARWLAPKAIDYSRFSKEALVGAAVETLAQNLTVDPATRGTTIGLSYLHTSPYGAEAIVRAVVEESVKRWGAVVAPPEGKDWLDVKVKDAADEEAIARSELQAFAERSGSTDFTQEITTLTTSSAALVGNLRLAKMKCEENDRVLAKMQEQIAGLEPQIREVLQEVYATDEVRQGAQAELVRLRVAQAGERSDAGDRGGTPAMQRINQQITALEQQLERLGAGDPARTIGLRPNPRYAALDDGIRSRELELIALHAQIPLYEQSLVEVQATLEEKRRLQREVDRLHERLREATGQYKRLLEISKTFQVNSELDVRGLTNLRIVEPAEIPRTKEGPRRGKILVAAMFGSMLLVMSVLIVRLRLSRVLLRNRDVMFAVGRSDVVALPALDARNVERFNESKRRGWE